MKPALVIAILSLASSGFAGPLEVSSLPATYSFKVDPYIRAVVELQKMGKETACQALLDSIGTNRDLRVYYKYIVLCRMLFTAREGQKFRRAEMGGTDFPGGTQYADWPFEPIELVDGVPFMIAGSYRGGGRREQADAYLRYCMENCDWNKFQFHEMSAKEKAGALDKLLKSPKWKRPLTGSETNALSGQIE